MIDREKVIKGLKCCLLIHRGGLLEESCNQCPYQAEPKATCDCQHLLCDAQVMLKEQEKIINEYHKADAFLSAHGWEWKHD